MNELFTASLPLALAGAIGVLALIAVRGFALGYPRARMSTRILSAKEQAIVAACADALFPPGGPIPLSGTEAGLVEYTERYIERAPPAMRLLIRLLFHSVEHAPWIFGPFRPRFTRLTQDERVAVLAAMSNSRIYFRRVTFLSLRTMLSMGYLANEDVARAIGITHCAAPFERRHRDRTGPGAPAEPPAPPAASGAGRAGPPVLPRGVPA